MADNIQQPTPPDYPYGQYKRLPGTSGIPAFPDTFIGPRTKHYADFWNRNLTRLRGTNGFYYAKEDHPLRIDGDSPLSSNPDLVGDPLANKKHAGMALYGEHVIVGLPLDSVRHEVTPDWPFLDPILVRGLLRDMEHENEADERGLIHVRRVWFDLARVLCEKEWNIRPRTGDIVRFTAKLDGYYTIEDVDTEETRLGSSGFFTVYKCHLWRSSKYEPQRIVAERQKITDEEIDSVQTTGEDP